MMNTRNILLRFSHVVTSIAFLSSVILCQISGNGVGMTCITEIESFKELEL